MKLQFKSWIQEVTSIAPVGSSGASATNTNPGNILKDLGKVLGGGIMDPNRINSALKPALDQAGKKIEDSLLGKLKAMFDQQQKQMQKQTTNQPKPLTNFGINAANTPQPGAKA